ncbi:hypothetical protein ACFLWI_02000 [Chloroflexota bacterium]
MAKGAYLTPRIKHLIAEIYRKNRSLGPTRTREELLKKMKEEGLDKYFGPNFPSISSVSKELTEYKKNDEGRSSESKALDAPWTFGSLAEYPISPDAIPIVVSIYEKCFMENLIVGCQSDDWLLSVREALWIGRLHKIIELYKPRHVLPDVRDAVFHRVIHPTKAEQEMLNELEAKNKATNQELALVWGIKGKEIPIEDIVLEWAFTYSISEELSEIEGEPFDSSELDYNMMRDLYEYWGDRREEFIENIAETYGIDEYELRENPNLSIGDILKFAASHSSRIQPRDEALLAKYYEKYYEKDVKKKEAQNERPHNQEE